MPIRINTNAVYVVQRERMLVNGVLLHKGDRLPADSPVRNMPARLRSLISLRWLSVEPTVEAPRLNGRAKAVNDAPGSREREYKANRLASLKRPQLVALAVKHGLRGSGKNEDLRQRLAEAGVA